MKNYNNTFKYIYFIENLKRMDLLAVVLLIIYWLFY